MSFGVRSPGMASLASRSKPMRYHEIDAAEASVERLGTFIDVLQIYRLDRDVGEGGDYEGTQ